VGSTKESHMATVIDDRLAEGKLDLVPMIDCIMLLLLFFILTTKFISEEKRIQTLLPTTSGDLSIVSNDIPKEINICVFPAGMEKGLQPSEYLQLLRSMQARHPIFASAWLKIGVSEPLVIDAKLLNEKKEDVAKQEVELIDAYVRTQLQRFELPLPGDRRQQLPIIIHCFSGLSWKLALVAYDAVRSYEMDKIPYPVHDERRMDIRLAREVSFASPRVRDYSPNELGQELFEIVNLK
jgi:hypothetical protein